MLTRSKKKEQLQAWLASKSTKPEKKNTIATAKDVSENTFNKYITKCAIYWKMKESNELLSIKNKINPQKYSIPTPRPFLTASQRITLMNLRNKHKSRMQENSRLIHFKLKHHKTTKTKQELEILWKQYNKNEPIGSECPCCQIIDYIPPSTTIIGQI